MNATFSHRQFFRLWATTVGVLLSIPAAHATLVELTDVAQLDARGGHACVVTTGGAVKCWGASGSGQLGGGSASYRSAAGPVTGLSSGVLAVAVNGGHSCAIVTGGGVKCWGANSNGQLGDGTTTQSAVPVDVQGLPWPVAALTLGSAHTCALSNTGAVACWGSNASGQLGDGTTTQQLAPTPVVGLSSGVVAISAARSYSCAIAAAGVVKCWGASNGQLGSGATPSLTPADVSGLPTGATSISTGGSPSAMFHGESVFACAVVAGTTKCWGRFGDNQFQYMAPSDVSGVASGALAITSGGGRGFTFVLQGTFTYAQSCIVTSGNGVQCWGQNYCGIVGVPTGADCSNLGQFSTLPPTGVPGLSSGVASVSAASDFTCALQSAGTVKCWGRGYGTQPTAQMSGTLPQVITFGSAPYIPTNGTEDLTINGGGSGNPVILASQTPGICSVSGNAVTGIAAGTCTLTANQAGDGVYYDAALETTFSLSIDSRIEQTIAFGPAPNLVVDGVGTVTATATSGLPVDLSALGAACTLSGNVVRGISTGTCTILALQQGGSTHTSTQAFLNFPVGANPGTKPLVVYHSGGGSGTVTSSPAGIDCGSTCVGNFANSSTLTLTATPGPGAVFEGWNGACPGTGPCTLTMDAAKTVYARFASDAPRLVNVSTRAKASTGSETLIAGFVIGGTTSKTVAIVVTGPSLAAYGIPNPLLVSSVHLMRSSDQAVLASNEYWGGAPNAAQLQAAGLAPSSNQEDAILATLPPGAYTALVAPFPGFSGTAVVGVYEVDNAGAPLVNLSTRGMVGTGSDVMIAGFIIQGNAPQQVAIVATGPSLSAYGVTNPLPDPTLTLVRSSDQVVLATNDNWATASNASQLQAAGFAPSNASEAAILTTLPPGAYTAIVSGVGGTTGISVVGVYAVP